MLRRSGFQYPDVLLAATIEDRNRLGIREAYYRAKNLQRQGEEFVQGNFSENEKVHAALAVCEKIMSTRYISTLLGTLLRTYDELYESGGPLNIKIVAPTPFAHEQSSNVLSPTFVALLQKRLQQALDYQRIHATVTYDFRVHSLLKVKRTVTLSENRAPQEKIVDSIGLLARQPRFAGPVDHDSIYILADDSIRRQTTFANLAAFITANQGVIGAATALIGVAESSRVQAYPQTLNLLQEILHRRGICLQNVNEVLNDPRMFGDLNLYTGTQEQNTLTNLEVLLLTSYFADRQDQQEFEAALELAGCRRSANHTISDYLKLSQLLGVERAPASAEGLREILGQVLRQHHLLPA